MIDSVFCTSSDDKLVTLTVQDKQDAIDNNDEGDVFGIESDLEALVKTKQQDTQPVQIKVISIDPFVIRVGITAEPTWKYTI